ncbi:MAG: hypothetical protein LBP40_05315 [Campylobacteraceae bacterium]|jgi:hypothetical protein|nr:hypothetical protein [Campylobacteraceae bacterium]
MMVIDYKISSDIDCANLLDEIIELSAVVGVIFESNTNLLDDVNRFGFSTLCHKIESKARGSKLDSRTK